MNDSPKSADETRGKVERHERCRCDDDFMLRMARKIIIGRRKNLTHGSGVLISPFPSNRCQPAVPRAAEN